MDTPTSLRQLECFPDNMGEKEVGVRTTPTTEVPERSESEI